MSKRPYNNRDNKKRPYTRNTSHNNMNMKEAKESTVKSQRELDAMCLAFWESSPYVSTPGKYHELEIKFNTLKGSKRLNRTDYDNVIKQLLSLGFTSKNMDGEYLLRIQNEYLDPGKGEYVLKRNNIRTEISGMPAIQHYCKGNDILSILNDPLYSRSVSMERKSDVLKNGSEKEYIQPVEFIDFDFKATYSIEESFNIISRTGIVKGTVDNWNKNKKTFRYLNRITLTHDDYPVKIDISIVKSSRYLKGKQERTYTTTESNVFYAEENYEIEIEIDNSKLGPLTDCVDIKDLISKVKKVAKFIMMGIQETNYPICNSEYRYVTQNYLKLIDQNPEYSLDTKHFVGPSSYTLQLKHIQDVEETNQDPNIRIDYTVTDKADGERRLLFIGHTGNMYLINTNMKILFTGAKTSNQTYFNSILDGEIIMHDKNGKYINLFAIFDVYFVNKIDVRHHVFIEPIVKEIEKDEKRAKSRGSIMNEIVNNLNVEAIVKDENTPIRVSAKQFYLGTDKVSIFSGCSSILKRVQDGLFEYNTDGLIFTPAKFGVGSDSIGKSGPLRKITWEYSFKWKPSEYNTIDFMITTVKDDKHIDVTKTIFETGENAATSVHHKTYKTLVLRCGFDEKVHGYINPCQDVLDDVVPSHKDERDTKTGYQPMQFIPTEPYDADAGLCNIMLRPDANGEDKMYTEENDVIEDKTIVEFSYDTTREKGWNWVPLRVRYDKTADLKRGGKNFGNAYHVANSNWHSIHYPITEEMIRTGKNIPQDSMDDDVYYKKTKGDTYTRSLRDFHNLYIKSKLIRGVANKGDTLIDFACGRGGDFSKWINAKISFVFGVDLSPDNIENRLTGACARYLNYKKSHTNVPRVLFVTGNSGYNIRSGQAIETEKGKQITASVFGNIAKDEKLGKGVSKNYAVGEEGFNISSCQFALHYFFKDKHVIHRFLANVAECTKIGGHFIGACYDGKKIFELLKNKKMNEEVQLYHNKKKIWGVKRLYPEDTFDDNISSLGYTIKVFQESINNYVDEYLVNFDYFIRLMENYGFRLIADNDAEDMGFPNGSGNFEPLYNRMSRDIKTNPRLVNEYGTAGDMQRYEKTISFNNRYFIFKKVSNVNIDNVLKSEKSETEEDNIKIQIDSSVKNQSETKEKEDDEPPKKSESSSKSETAIKTGKKTTIKRPRKLNQTITLQGTSSK